jgi:signal transduction histidine kinase
VKRALKDPVAVGIAVIGLVITIGLADLIGQDQQEDATRWLDERAELIERATEATITNTFRDLSAVAAFLNSSADVSQDEFASFVGQMDLDPGVIGVGYLQIVDNDAIDEYLDEIRRDVPEYQLLAFDGVGGIGPNASERSIYYPLRYVYGGPFLDIVIAETPIQSQRDALGFDVRTEPLWNPAFERAIALGEPSVSELLEVGGIFEEQAFGVAHPLFDDSGNLDGLLVAPGLEFLLTADLGISITSNVTWSIDNRTGVGDTTAWPMWTRELNLPGSTWTLTVQPTASALRAVGPRNQWLAIVLGLGLSLLLATTAHQMRLRRREREEIEQLQRVSTDKDRFLAAVSHELRTPLTVVIGLAHELADRDGRFEDEERATLLAMIGEHSEEAGAIVEDLLVAARTDIGKLVTYPEAVDLAETVTAVVEESSLPSFRFVGDPGVAWADPQRVRQITRNLLTNAVRYGGPNTEVRFATNLDVVTVTVADDGTPIPAAEEQRIFDPYTSAHENGAQLGSIGLGLYISLKLATLMDGDLTYRHDGSHSLFELRLPRFTSNQQGALAPTT